MNPDARPYLMSHGIDCISIFRAATENVKNSRYLIVIKKKGKEKNLSKLARAELSELINSLPRY